MCDRLLHKFIVWPNHKEQQRISGAVADMSGVQNCIGFIDGTQIALSFIPNGDKDYINRKGFPSIQLQVVVDDRMKKFLYIKQFIVSINVYLCTVNGPKSIKSVMLSSELIANYLLGVECFNDF